MEYNQTLKLLEQIARNTSVLPEIYEILTSEKNQNQIENTSTDSMFNDCDLRKLAYWIGNSYHTNYKTHTINEKINDLIGLVRGEKFHFLLSWLRKNNRNTLPKFWNLPIETQRRLCNKVLSRYRDAVEETIKGKYSPCL